MPRAARYEQHDAENQGQERFHSGLGRLPTLCRNPSDNTSLQKSRRAGLSSGPSTENNTLKSSLPLERRRRHAPFHTRNTALLQPNDGNRLPQRYRANSHHYGGQRAKMV